MKKPQSKLNPKVEQAIEQAKKETRELKKNMGIQLRKIFDKQLAKHRKAEEELIRKLDRIISQKQNHGK